MTPAGDETQHRPRPIFGAMLTVAVLVALVEAAKQLGWLPALVPAPSDIAAQIIANPGFVMEAMGATAWRALTGFVIAAAITIVAAGVAAVVRALSAPITTVGGALHAVPAIVATPLVAVLVGNGPHIPAIVAALACQFPLLAGAMRGLRAADARQRTLFHILAANRWQTMRYLLAPAALPEMFAACRIAAPAAVIGATTAEWMGAQRGVGAMMIAALFSSDVPKIWLAAISTCALASGVYGLVCLIEVIAIRDARRRAP